MDRAGFVKAILELGRAAAEGELVVHPSLELLDRHVGADALVFSVMDVRGGGRASGALRHMDPLTSQEREEWVRLIPTHPYAQWHLTAPLGTSRATDIIEIKAFERLELYQTLLRPRGQRYQAGLLFDRRGTDVTLLSLWRDARDFTDAEIEALEVARGILMAGFETHAARLRARAWAGPDLDTTRLTPRQAEVAALVARGLTNDQIALRLDIRPRTVRKHLEGIFAATGCRSRTAVALWWHHDGGRRAT
jgi:DNA-binding CsgD family transcriptional regulator